MSTTAISEVAFWGALLFLVAVGVTGTLIKGYNNVEKSSRVPRARSKAARKVLRNRHLDLANVALQDEAVQKEIERLAELNVRKGVALEISTTVGVVGFDALLTVGYLIGSMTVVVVVAQVVIAAVWVIGLVVVGPRTRRNSRKFLAQRVAPDGVATVPTPPIF